MSKVFVSRETFIDAFEKAWADLYADPVRREHLEQDYGGSKERWTAAICSEGKTHLGRDCLVAETFASIPPLKFDCERHKVDAFGRVYPRMVDDEYVDGVNVVMLEVENNTKKSYEEFWKLTQSRCPLKVLVAYEMANAKELEDARNRMQMIYRDHCDVLGPDNPSAYLLVIGTRDKGSATIRWKYFGMSDAGRLDHEFHLPLK